MVIVEVKGFKVFQTPGTIPTNCGLIPSFLDNDVHILFLFFYVAGTLTTAIQGFLRKISI